MIASVVILNEKEETRGRILGVRGWKIEPLEGE